MLGFLRRRWYLVLIIAVCIGGFLWYQSSNTAATEKKEKKYTVKKQTLQDTLTLSGSVNAAEWVVLRFQTSGRLAWVGVKEGDTVKKYQGIASLDQRDVQNKLQQYLNTFVKERNTFDQSVDDNGRNENEAVTVALQNEAKRLVQNAQYDLNNSILNVQLQQLAIENSYLSSPIEGIVTKVDVPIAGVNITPANAEFEIINTGSIYFSALADQTDVVKLSNGMNGKVIFDSYPDSEVMGTIQNIAYTPKQGETGTVYEIKMAFDPYHQPVRIGMSGDVDFVIGEYVDVLAVPNSFIKTEPNGKKYVTVGKNGSKTKTEVKTGETFDTFTQITSGLHEGDVVYD